MFDLRKNDVKKRTFSCWLYPNFEKRNSTVNRQLGSDLSVVLSIDVWQLTLGQWVALSCVSHLARKSASFWKTLNVLPLCSCFVKGVTTIKAMLFCNFCVQWCLNAQWHPYLKLWRLEVSFRLRATYCQLLHCFWKCAFVGKQSYRSENCPGLNV